jgi:hypothetical protein
MAVKSFPSSHARSLFAAAVAMALAAPAQAFIFQSGQINYAIDDSSTIAGGTVSLNTGVPLASSLPAPPAYTFSRNFLAPFPGNANGRASLGQNTFVNLATLSATSGGGVSQSDDQTAIFPGATVLRVDFDSTWIYQSFFPTGFFGATIDAAAPFTSTLQVTGQVNFTNAATGVNLRTPISINQSFSNPVNGLRLLNSASLSFLGGNTPVRVNGFLELRASKAGAPPGTAFINVRDFEVGYAPATATYTGPANGSWSAANFTGDIFAGAPFLSNHRARFPDDSGTARNITLPVGGVFFGTLDVDGRASTTFSGGSLTINTFLNQRNTSGNGSLIINASLFTSGTFNVNNDSTGPIILNGTVSPGFNPDVADIIKTGKGPLEINAPINQPVDLFVRDGSVRVNAFVAAAAVPTGSFYVGDGSNPASLTVDAAVRLRDLGIAHNSTATLQIASGAMTIRRLEMSAVENSRLDLRGSRLIIDYQASNPMNEVVALIKRGYNNGAWNGLGIMTSLATAGSPLAIGYALPGDIGDPTQMFGVDIDPTTLLVRTTRFGDADLNGVVNIADFSLFAGNFGQTGTRWSLGDFNYDGVTNIGDFSLLAVNFGASFSRTAVPEPVAIGLLVPLLVWRRRRA